MFPYSRHIPRVVLLSKNCVCVPTFRAAGLVAGQNKRNSESFWYIKCKGE